MNYKENGKAHTIKKFFSRSTEITKFIPSDPVSIWKVLLDGEKYTEWNSTITMFEGEIRKGNTIKLKSYLDEKRVFKLKIKEVVTNHKLVWGDGMGNRIFLLRPNDGGTYFTMKETIGGPLFPLFSRMIPSFDSAFELFANDLDKTVTKKS